LLEAWLRFGRAELVGESGPTRGRLLRPCFQTWRSLAEGHRRFDLENPQEAYLSGVGRSFYVLALMDRFGLVEVELPPRPVAPWCPADVKLVPFGDAIVTLINSRRDSFLEKGLPRDDDEDRQDEPLELPRFGVWQPLFQPYFPEWRENLKFPRMAPREGTFVFRVSWGKVWRLIAMPADATLDDLVTWILRSVRFDSDHLYKFSYRARMGTEVVAYHPGMHSRPWADQIQMAMLPLEPGQTIALVYDFGDNCEFTVKLERVEPPGARVKAPRIRESHGKAPRQYPPWDD